MGNSGSGGGSVRVEDIPEHLGTAHIVKRGAHVWNRGTRRECVYFLRRGEVCICVEDQKGRDVVIRIVRPGECFGLTCFSDEHRASPPTAARTAVDSEILEIPYVGFIEFLHNNEPMLFGMLATLSERLAHAEERIRVLANRDAEDRLCALLGQLVRRTGRPARTDPELFRIQFTHAELAELGGLNRAHVSIVMGRLRDKGIVEYGRNTALMVNRRALADRRKANGNGTGATRGPVHEAD